MAEVTTILSVDIVLPEEGGSSSIRSSSSRSYSSVSSVSVPSTREEREVDTACSLSISINSEDNEGSSEYYVGTAYNARLYVTPLSLSPFLFNTNGELVSVGIGTAPIGESEELYITFTGSNRANLPYVFDSGFNVELVGDAYNADGDVIADLTIRIPSSGHTEVLISAKAYAVFRISYTTQYTVLRFTGTDVGKAILTAAGECPSGNEVSSTTEVEFIEISSSSFSSSSSFNSTAFDVSTSLAAVVDVTLSYKDFVTGAGIVGANVYLNGTKKGTTDDTGKIVLKGLRANKIYKVKATKEGYLSTDSDSLANDQFIVPLED